jgi:hypothetical protein
MIQKIIKKLLLLAIFARLVFLFYTDFALYTTPFNIASLEDKYFTSSYILGDKASHTLSDADLYVVEGNMLVNQGKDLEKLTPGHPPLGKYIIGLSQKFFHNPYVFQFVSFALVLFVFFNLSNSLFLTLILSFEPLLVSQINKTLLDTYLLVFQLAAIWFFLKFLKQKKPKFATALFISFFIGLSLATKFFPVSFPLVVSLVLFTLISGNFKKFTQLTLSLPFAGLAFLLGHLSYFVHHPSLILFIKYIRYQINWWAGSPQVAPFSIFKIIFSNQWSTWWGEGIIKVKDWWLGWPILTSLALVSFQNKFLFVYLIISLFFLSFQAVFPRHLLSIMPIIYLLAYGTINRLWQKVKTASSR